MTINNYECKTHNSALSSCYFNNVLYMRSFRSDFTSFPLIFFQVYSALMPRIRRDYGCTNLILILLSLLSLGLFGESFTFEALCVK